MGQTDTQVLNKKLAEWAGFEFVQMIDVTNFFTGSKVGKQEQWRYSDNSFGDLPNFTNSLDACFKWLVPIAIDRIMSEQECSSDLAYEILFKKWMQELQLDIPHHTLTLCLTIEKVIDGTS